ncbi:MAG: hypothetical protein JST67_07500 [Bacteroidetes bacterium]|nr:hypothetical protein [Bacteroidota bacterium]
MLKTNKLTTVICAAALAFCAFKGDKDALDKKIYTLQVNEIKNGQAKNKKPFDDELEFKDGKLISTFLIAKHEFKWIKYKVTKDSTYDDEGTTKRWIEAQGMFTNDADETMTVTLKVDEYDIDGSYNLTKKDIPKKLYEFIGKEKVKKK